LNIIYSGTYSYWLSVTVISLEVKYKLLNKSQVWSSNSFWWFCCRITKWKKWSCCVWER